MAAIHGKNYGNPTLDLNFAGNKSLVDTTTEKNYVTFSRAQSGNEATYIGSDGLIKYAAADEARFDHDPATLQSLGLLIEESRTNEIPYSEDFTHSSWTNVNVTVTSNNTTAPDGTLNAADRLQIGATNGVIYNNTVGGVTSNSTISVWIKAVSPGTSDVFRLGSAGSLSADITATNQWTRYTYTSTTFTSSLHGIVRPSDNTAADIYVWGAQFEENKTFPTSYIPTTTSTVTRNADVASITGSNFSSWYNQSEGTFQGIGKQTYTTPNQFESLIVGGSFPNRSWSWAIVASVSLWSSGTDGLGSGNFYTNLTPNVPFDFNVIQAQSSTSVAIAADGVIKASGARSVDLYNISSLSIGYNYDGTIKRLSYWPKRLPDIELQQLTK